jgi:hypothetical protein
LLTTVRTAPNRIPFYVYIRLLFLLYLVFPQTQGARLIYEKYIHPKLEENESAIEEFIASAHERLRRAGIDYIKRAIEVVKTSVLGLPPTPEAAASPPEPQTAQSYTQALLARFTLPSARWTATTPGTGPSTGAPSSTAAADFYNLLASAVSSAMSAATTGSGSASGATPGGGGGAAAASAVPSALSMLIPESIRSASAPARVSFIQAQRERLRIVLSALDREEAAAAAGQDLGAQELREKEKPGSMGSISVVSDNGAGGASSRRSLSEQSIASGLSKSRSEADFEKLEAESGEEMDMQGVDTPSGGGGARRRVAGQDDEARSGGWLPWGWGTGGGDAGRSSGLEN